MSPCALPFTVEPHDRRVVASDDLFELGSHDFVITLVVGVFAVSCIVLFLRNEVRMVPIHDGVVGTELDPLLLTLVAQLLQWISLEQCIPDVPSALVRRIHGESFVVLAGNDDVLHSGIFCRTYDLFRIEVDGIELLLQWLPIDSLDLSGIH